jgi:cytochrome P450
MSNLFAALGWMLVDLLTRPDELCRVRAGDRARAEVCALESTRLAQRSIMARYVVDPVTLDVGGARYEVGAGATVATLLPLTNTTAAPGLEHWDPDRWNRRRLADPSALAAVELVTVFGHGRHTCPAQPFSLSTMTTAASRLFVAFDLEREWEGHPQPVRTQIGGVARAAGPCPVRYRRR